MYFNPRLNDNTYLAKLALRGSADDRAYKAKTAKNAAYRAVYDNIEAGFHPPERCVMVAEANGWGGYDRRLNTTGSWRWERLDRDSFGDIMTKEEAEVVQELREVIRQEDEDRERAERSKVTKFFVFIVDHFVMVMLTVSVVIFLLINCGG